MDLDGLLVFARVVQTGSFTQAAQDLGLPKSTVSRKIAKLEERLGVRLLQRTTRRLRLTEVGAAVQRHAARIAAEAEEAELAATRLQEAPRGLLRVTAPLGFSFLGPIVAEYLVAYPEVQIELVCTDRLVDLVQEGFDLAIRAGALADSTLVARRLAVARGLLVASPTYLLQHGRPAEPRDLQEHHCLLLGGAAARGRWELTSGSRRVEVQVQGRLTVNDLDVLHACAVAGLGVALIPEFRCQDEVQTEELERVLPEWTAGGIPIHALYPSTRHLSPKVRELLDLLGRRVASQPWSTTARAEARRPR